MTNTWRLFIASAVTAAFFSAFQMAGGPAKPSYRVLAPTTQDNLTIFPIVTNSTRDTHDFLTLDEGLRSGQVVVTEQGSAGLVRPRPGLPHPGPFPLPNQRGAEVNRLVLINNSELPLILLAGEIVTGGKQDRVVGKDRIVAPKSDPVDLSVFCVEPHRWTETSATFGGLGFSMAQPSVRQKAMADKDQQQVWDEVSKSRASVASQVPVAAPMLQETSSYAKAMGNRAVQERVDSLAAPIERSYDRLMSELRAQKAVGAVVAVNGEIVWADVFADSALLTKYWPKLIRSYAAEAVSTRWRPGGPRPLPSVKEAQSFLDNFNSRRESVESEPGVYKNTELVGSDFDAFVLTSLLPGTGFDLHVAKMKM
jgi:hypothetical protein